MDEETSDDFGDATPVGGDFPTASRSFGSLLNHDPKLSREFRKLDPVLSASAFASLLLRPELQANCYRLEGLVHLALGLGAGSRGPSASVASFLFAGIGEGVAGRMEDPAEDVFVSSVATADGNFRILEGTWEAAGFHVQRLLNVLDRLPKQSPFINLRRHIYALLRLSDVLCEKAGLVRNQLGNELPAARIPHAILATTRSQAEIVKFTRT